MKLTTIRGPRRKAAAIIVFECIREGPGNAAKWVRVREREEERIPPRRRGGRVANYISRLVRTDTLPPGLSFSSAAHPPKTEREGEGAQASLINTRWRVVTDAAPRKGERERARRMVTEGVPEAYARVHISRSARSPCWRGGAALTAARLSCALPKCFCKLLLLGRREDRAFGRTLPRRLLFFPSPPFLFNTAKAEFVGLTEERRIF